MLDCRGCGSRDVSFVRGSESFYYCRRCLLVQRRELGTLGRTSGSTLGPVQRLVERHGLGAGRLVIGVGAVMLLDQLADHGIDVLAIEGDREAAMEARRAGIPVIEGHFGPELAEALGAAGRRADLVLAPGFGRMDDPVGVAAAIAAVLKTSGTAEIAFASAAKIVPQGGWAVVAAEATLPTLDVASALFEEHGLHLNDATRAGRHHLLRVTASTERRQSQRLAGLLAEERRIGAHAPRFYAGTATDLVSPRRGGIGEGVGARP
jgi:hypothetical protein